MASGEFKHIAVSAPEEEDEVIYVGATAKAEEEAGSAGEAGVGVADAVEDEGQPASAAFEPNGGTSALAEGGQEADERAEAEPAAQRQDASRGSAEPAARRKAEPYRQTTLEDLNAQKMPLVQKVVIIAAVLCIIGAVAYYFLFMG